MASSLFVLLDDIATVLDDIAALSQIAAKKTAGVLGDDLALNAQQVSGIRADRELPVIWQVAKGSMLNKVILVPTALALSYFAKWLILPLLLLGGAFLCYEGFEKVWHTIQSKRTKADRDHDHALHTTLLDPSADFETVEKDAIKGAIRTDFILSAEIIVIALGTVATATFAKQAGVLVTIAVLMTVGVYGLVAGIVKLDDLGLALSRRGGAAKAVGQALLSFAPKLMKFLSIAGTLAMFLVGGGIVAEAVPTLHHAVEKIASQFGMISGEFVKGLIGLAVGAVVVGVIALVKKFGGAKAPEFRSFKKNT